MNIGNRYSSIMWKALLVSLTIIVIGIILYYLDTYGEQLLWIGIITLNIAPLLGLLFLLIHYIKIGDKKILLAIMIIVLFIIINILINIFG